MIHEFFVEAGNREQGTGNRKEGCQYVLSSVQKSNRSPICTISGALMGHGIGTVMSWAVGDTIVKIFPNRIIADYLYNLGQAILPWVITIVGAIFGYRCAKKYT